MFDETPKPEVVDPFANIPEPVVPELLSTPTPVMPVPPQSSVFAANQTAPVRAGRRGHLKFIIFSIVFIILLVGAALAGYYYWQQAHSPARIMSNVEVAMSTVKNAAYNLAFTVSGKVLPPKGNDSGKGTTDVTANLIVDGTVSESTIGANASLTVTNDGTDQGPYSLGFRSLDDKLYFKVGGVTQPPDGETTGLAAIPVALQSILSSLADQWIFLDIVEAKKQLDNSKALADANSALNLSVDDKKAINDILVAALPTILTGFTTGANTTIAGLPVHDYKFTVDNIALMATLKDIHLKQPTALNERDLTKLTEAIRTLGSMTGEVWVGTTDNLIHKIALTASIDTTANTTLKGKFEGPLSVVFSLTLTDINTTSDVVAPENASSLQDVFAKIMAEKAAQAAADKLDVDNDGLSAKDEAKYGTDPNNGDTDGDGFLDGAEVAKDYNPLGSGLLSAVTK